MRRSILGMACLFAGLLVVPGAASPALASPDGDRVLNRAAAVIGGDDGRAHITFTFKLPPQLKQKDQRIRYAMLWKHTPKDREFDSKVIYFTEFPKSDQGKAYLGYIRPPGVNKPNKEWLYLPELLAVRQLTSHKHQHGAQKPDEFSPSVLTHTDLMERLPELDDNQRLGDDTLNGKAVWRVESRPKKANPAYPYSAVIRWIDKRDHLTLRTEYMGPNGTPVKRADTTWRRVDGEWVWKKVVADHLKNGAQTIIEMTDVKVNTNLSDRIFTPRTLSRGPKRFF